jgi:NADH:ubiquinone oxidoreductase subunit 2 (subunit N)
VVGSFYYLRLIKWMFFKDSTDFVYKTLNDITLMGSARFAPLGSYGAPMSVSFVNSLILGFSLFVLLTFLLYPNPLLNIIFESLANSLF